ncbi:MAG TPA: class I SAM-dependent methyltransferase, partial [Gemmata sp.]
PGVTTVRLGSGGVLLPVVSCGLGFALVRRAVLERVAATAPPGTPPSYFAAPDAGTLDAEDVTFCARAAAAGFVPTVDTSIRLWRTGVTRLGWEDAGGDRPRADAFTLRLLPAGPDQPAPADPKSEPAPAGAPTEPPRNSLRAPAQPLPPTFPRVGLYVVTYPGNAASLEATLASLRASDWGTDPVVLVQPEDWAVGRESGARNFKRALEAADADGCDFALILEDDVRAGRYLRHNLLTNPLVVRDQCDYLSLFVPDLLADPWERSEPHLGYRLAKPRYAGPNALWERHRVWGSQGYLLSRRLVRAALDRWDRLREGQDTRILGVCAEFRLPLWYTDPCLIDHAPATSAFGTPAAYAPDFDPGFRFQRGAGFQPPEEVPGWLTRPEAELLWRTGAGLAVLELGTARGRSTVCLGQSARHLTAVDVADQTEAAEWVRRFGLADRVTFRRGDVADVCRELTGPFDLIFIDTLHAAASVERDIASARPLLAPHGRLAFHDYPDPGWPDVRRVVDAHARRYG